MKKGVSPVISLILLITITLTSSLVFYVYFRGVQSGAQTETEEASERFTETANINLKISSLDCKATLRKNTAGYWNLNEEYGSKFRDLSNHDNDGTLRGDGVLNGKINGCGWTRGRTGKALDFTDCQVKIENQTDLDMKQQVTIMGWFKSESEKQQVLLAKPDLNGDYAISLSGGTLKGRLPSLEDANFSGEISCQASLGEWHHFALTWDNEEEKVRLYLDGKLRQERANADGNLSIGEPLYIGNDAAKEVPFQGKLDEIAIFNRSLKRREVKEHYQTGNLRRKDIEGLWKFERGFGKTVYDTHHIITGIRDGLSISKGSSVTVKESEELSPSNQITLEGFIKPEEEINGSSSEGYGLICTATYYTSYCLYHPSGKGELKFRLTGLGSLLSNKEEWGSKWHHVAAVYDGEEMKLYVNGKLDSSKKISGSFQKNKGKVTIGNILPRGSSNYPGTIGELRISNGALSSSLFLNRQIRATLINTGESKVPEGDWVMNLKKDGDTLVSNTFHKKELEKNKFLSFSLPIQNWDLKEGETYKVELNPPKGASISQNCEGS